MKCFFCSDNSAFLKCNGSFLGEINCNLKYCEVLKNSLIEVLPTSKTLLPLYVNSSNFLGTFTANFNEYHLFYFKLNKRRNLPFKLLKQQNFYENGNNYTITIISDGVLKFYLDGGVYALDELPINPTSVDLKIYGNYLFLSFYSKKVAIFVYDITNSNLVYKNLVDAFEINDTFTTTTYKNCGVDIVIKEKWHYDSGFLKNEKSVQKNASIFSINKNILAVIFLNLLKEDGDVLEFLHPSLHDRVNDLKEFVLDFETAYLNPFDFDETLVIYKDKLSVFRFEFIDGKISNIVETN